MRLRVGLAVLNVCLMAGCDGAPGNDSGNDRIERAAVPAAPQTRPGPPPALDVAPPEAAVEVPEEGPGLGKMNPYQRRAYDKGYRDCSAGRYEPDPWPEAYRIGCGAAQERQ